MTGIGNTSKTLGRCCAKAKVVRVVRRSPSANIDRKRPYKIHRTTRNDRLHILPISMSGYGPRVSVDKQWHLLVLQNHQLEVCQLSPKSFVHVDFNFFV